MLALLGVPFLKVWIRCGFVSDADAVWRDAKPLQHLEIGDIRAEPGPQRDRGCGFESPNNGGNKMTSGVLKISDKAVGAEPVWQAKCQC